MSTTEFPEQKPSNLVKRTTFEFLTVTLRSVIVVVLASTLFALRLRKQN
ncbi:MAG: hypothetical protein P8Z40_04760 [Chloroflexota bacterium]|jgi:hypothetical protein